MTSFRAALSLFIALPAMSSWALAQGAIRLARQSQASVSQLGRPGTIIAAAEDQSGRIFILDARSRITVVSGQLAFLGTVAQQPSGAMLFRDAIALGVLPDGRVAVLDRARQSITIMRPQRGGIVLAPSDTVSLEQPAEGMCVLSANEFLVYGALHGRRLHVVNLSGKLLRSFAPIDSAVPPIAHDQLSMGSIGCNTSQGEVILTSAFLPVVEAFRIATGERTWIDSLRPYRPVTLTIGEQSMSIRTGRGGHSLIRTAITKGSCRLFQADFVGRQDGGNPDTVMTYLYRGTEQRWEQAQLGTSRLIPLRTDRFLSVSFSDSIVQVQRLSIGGCSASDSRGLRASRVSGR